MSYLDGWRHRVAVLLGRDRYQREVDEEVRFHLEADAVHEHAAAPDAGERARRRFGNATYIREEVRRMTGYAPLDNLQQDLRFALRGLRRHRSFAIVVVVVLALGIGANTAIFSFLNNVALRPLPYAAPAQLVRLSTQLVDTHEGASYPDFLDWKSRNRTMSAVSAWRSAADNFAPPGEEPERLRSARVTADFFRTLGVAPVIGRDFTAADAVFGAHTVVIISNALWHRRYNGDRNVVGKTLILNTVTYTIIGVAPPAMQLPERTQLWAPMVFGSAASIPGRRNDFLGVVGRMKPGVTREAAQDDLSAVARQLAQEYPNTNGTAGVLIEPLRDVIVGKAGSMLLLLAGAVGLVLLIACANVANLLLARGATRSREMAVRAALGAGRARLVRQLLTESVLLATIGGLAGVLVAVAGVNGLKTMLPYDFPRLNTVRIDGAALLFSLALSMVTGVLFGVIPALRLSREALAHAMTEGGRGSTGARAERVRSGLVLAQTALALILLSGAGLMVHSLMQLRQVQLGFEPHGTLAAQVVLPSTVYGSSEKQRVFFDAFRERLRAVPGVQRVGLTTDIPLGGGYNYSSITISGQPPVGPTEKGPDIIPSAADSEYFATMGMTLVAGRMFGKQDGANAPGVVIVNEETAKRYFGGKSPIGARLTQGNPADTAGWVTVVGVYRTTRLDGVSQESYPQMFGPLEQNMQRAVYLVARSASDPLALVPSIRRELRALDPTQPLTDIETMDDRVADSLGTVRLQSVLLSLFSMLALVLAAVGIYGVVAYAVVQRTREIGIRMALGATAAGVRRLVLRQGMRPVLGGAIVGMLGSIGLAQLIRSMTFQVGAVDPVTLAAATGILALVAAIACIIPAGRAARVLPNDALRDS
ncbi:MAG: ABC transporter permease [Casimicrobiaceae bacterium]